jgi:hypothetical protein
LGLTGGGGGIDRDGTVRLDEVVPAGAVVSGGVVVPGGVIDSVGGVVPDGVALPGGNVSFGTVCVVGVYTGAVVPGEVTPLVYAPAGVVTAGTV